MTTYRIPSRVAHDVSEGDASVYLMVLPDGPPLVLRATGAWIWLLAAEGVEDIVGEIARGTSSDPKAIRSEIDTFLDSLVQDGLLEVEPPLRATAH